MVVEDIRNTLLTEETNNHS